MKTIERTPSTAEVRHRLEQFARIVKAAETNPVYLRETILTNPGMVALICHITFELLQEVGYLTRGVEGRLEACEVSSKNKEEHEWKN